MIGKTIVEVFENDRAQQRPAAIRQLGVTGKMPVPSEGWTPFEK
jgi:hypothetical protein